MRDTLRETLVPETPARVRLAQEISWPEIRWPKARWPEIPWQELPLQELGTPEHVMFEIMSRLAGNAIRWGRVRRMPRIFE